jgi:hypothetical protein
MIGAEPFIPGDIETFTAKHAKRAKILKVFFADLALFAVKSFEMS